MKKLTPKQEAFCLEYLIDLNAKQAAIRAGYSEDTAAVIGCENLTKPNVSEYISSLQQERVNKTKVDADYVLKRLIEIDQMDVADILESDGSFKFICDWPKAWRQYLSGIDMAEMFEGAGQDRQIVGMLKKVKWPDKIRNLELLGKHIDVQAFKERSEVDVTVSHEQWLDNLK